MAEPTNQTAQQRIDKWLWHARFAKTRTLAQKLISSGGVRVDRQKISSSSSKVQRGQVLTLALPRGVMIVKILDFAERRGPYATASLLYEDLTPPPAKPTDEANIPTTASIQREKRPAREERREAIRMKRNFMS